MTPVPADQPEEIRATFSIEVVVANRETLLATARAKFADATGCNEAEAAKVIATVEDAIIQHLDPAESTIHLGFTIDDSCCELVSADA